MLKKIIIAVVAVVVLGALAGYLWLADMAQNSGADDYFEDAIVAFELADAQAPPAPGEIIFVGSSSIRFWSSLQADMGTLPVHNRGFGGAHMNHLIHNVERIINPYAPSMILVYAGDNDLAAGSGKTPERVLDDYRVLVERVHAKNPQTIIYFLSIKPSKLRWAQWPAMARANALVEAETRLGPRLRYVDVSSVLLDTAGEPRDDVFIFDGLHMNAEGYAAWTQVVRPILERDFSAAAGGG
jgi:lysophospholipase L1-like esterase